MSSNITEAEQYADRNSRHVQYWECALCGYTHPERAWIRKHVIDGHGKAEGVIRG